MREREREGGGEGGVREERVRERRRESERLRATYGSFALMPIFIKGALSAN